MKIYVKAASNYGEVRSICEPVRKELLKALEEVTPGMKWWDNLDKDNKDGTLRISFGNTGCESAKEARQKMLEAIKHCSKDLQDRIVKVTCGSSGGRGRTWFVVSVVVNS